MIEIKDLLRLQDEMLCRKISELSKITCYEKKSVIQKVGVKQDMIRILVDGVVRCYYYDAFKEEHTMCFMENPGDAVMVGSDRRLTMHGYVAVTPVTLLELPMAHLPLLLREYPEMQSLYSSIMMYWLSYHAEVSMLLRCANPTAKWKWFCDHYPESLKSAENKHIASFLGITPETLSRVKKRQPDELRCNGLAVIYEKDISFDNSRISIHE